MMDIKPKGYRVIVEQLDNRKIGNIELPENTKEAGINRYKVIAIGEPKLTNQGELIPIDLKIGDEILFDMRGCAAAGPPELFGGRTLAVVNVDFVLGVFTGEPDPPTQQIVRAQRIPQPVQ